MDGVHGGGSILYYHTKLPMVMGFHFWILGNVEYFLITIIAKLILMWNGS